MKLHPDYLRSVIFGFEDSLVSTTGVIAGVSVGSNNQKIVLLAGLVTIAVEALSMGAGQYISERSVHQIEHHSDSLWKGAFLMFASYFIAGFVPLLPVILFAYPGSIMASMAAALAGLFVLGYIKGRAVKTAPWRSGLEVLLIGGAATILGVIVGMLVKV